MRYRLHSGLPPLVVWLAVIHLTCLSGRAWDYRHRAGRRPRRDASGGCEWQVQRVRRLLQNAKCHTPMSDMLRGSGKASNLIAYAYMLKYQPHNPDYTEEDLRRLVKFEMPNSVATTVYRCVSQRG